MSEAAWFVDVPQCNFSGGNTVRVHESDYETTVTWLRRHFPGHFDSVPSLEEWKRLMEERYS